MKEERNWLEWAVLALGAVVVTLVLGYLVYLTLNQEKSPPKLQVEVGEPQANPGGYQVEITVKNQGGDTAESVEVEVSLEEEKSRFLIDFVPRGSEAQGWVCFTREPRAGQVKARVLGFGVP
jgi:uncharacterized protein (TIGR02588 family)